MESLLRLASDLKMDLFDTVSPSEKIWIGKGAGISGITYQYVIRTEDWKVELLVKASRIAQRDAISSALMLRKEEIEGRLRSLPDTRATTEPPSDDFKIYCCGSAQGWKTDEARWPAIQKAMINTMKALASEIGPLIERHKQVRGAPPTSMQPG